MYCHLLKGIRPLKDGYKSNRINENLSVTHSSLIMN